MTDLVSGLVVTARRYARIRTNEKSPASVIVPRLTLSRAEREGRRCKFDVDVGRRHRVAWRRAIRLKPDDGGSRIFFLLFSFFGEAMRLTDQLRYRGSSSFSPSKVTRRSLSWVVQAVEVTREGESRGLRGPRRGTWEGARHASTFEPSQSESTGSPSLHVAETSRMMFNWRRRRSARNGPLQFRLPGCLGSVCCHFDKRYCMRSHNTFQYVASQNIDNLDFHDPILASHRIIFNTCRKNIFVS